MDTNPGKPTIKNSNVLIFSKKIYMINYLRTSLPHLLCVYNDRTIKDALGFQRGVWSKIGNEFYAILFFQP